MASPAMAAVAPYAKVIKWGLIISVLSISHSCAYYKGREGIVQKTAAKQLVQATKDNKKNVERAEAVSTEKAQKDVRLKNKLEELDRAIEEAKAIGNTDSCQLSDDELRLLNEIFTEANRGMPRDGS